MSSVPVKSDTGQDCPAKFADFIAGGDTLRVYSGGRLVFASNKDRLLPLLDYIAALAGSFRAVTVFDRIVGNAAALLAVKAGAAVIYSPLASQPAIETCARYGVQIYARQIVPYITRPGGAGLCPMEQLSLGKEPDELLGILRKS